MITAHPTEVRRKTILEVLDQSPSCSTSSTCGATTPMPTSRIEHELSVCVLLLWQTALLRLSKLRVRDEINEAIRYYDTSLFEVIPALTRDLARRRRRGRRTAAGVDTSRLDHDGLVDRRRPRRQPVRHRRGRALRDRPPDRDGARDTISAAAPPVAPAVDDRSTGHRRATELLALAAGVGRRLAVPGRRAVPASAARHARPAARVRRAGCSTRRSRCPGRAPIGDSARRTPDLDRAGRRPRHRDRLAARPRRRRRSPTRSSSPCAAAWRSSAPTSAGSTCARTPPSTKQVLADLFATAGVCDDYLALDEAERVAAAGRRAAHSPAAASPRRRPTASAHGRSWRSSKRPPMPSLASAGGSCRTT